MWVMDTSKLNIWTASTLRQQMASAMLPKEDVDLAGEFVPGVSWGNVLHTWQQRAKSGVPIELAKTGNWRRGVRDVAKCISWIWGTLHSLIFDYRPLDR